MNRKRAFASILTLFGLSACIAGGVDEPVLSTTAAVETRHIKTVFVIVLENHDWSHIQGAADAPYINGTILPQASYALNYRNVPGIHPSLPNYLWLEAGDSLGVTADGDPAQFHQSTTDHLVTQLTRAGHTWKSYQEDIDGKSCPLTTGPFWGLFSTYVPRHDPMLYFDDVTSTNAASSASCIAHVRPFTELAGDLASGNVAEYNFITPNLCHDMHGGVIQCLFDDLVKDGDTWLSQNLPTILDSAAYKSGGAVFITFDENENDSAPIGMIALSPFAKGHGYTSTLRYDHSSTLRTIETIFNVPLLRHAQQATDLADLFAAYP